MITKMNTFLFASRIALIILVSGTSGCVTYDHSGAAIVAQWNSRFGVNTGNRPASSPWNTETVSLREFVYEGIAVKDYEYKKYVDLVRRGTSWSGFGAQTLAIGLNGAGTLTSGGTTKTLSAIAGAVTGTSAAFSKNILFDQSISTFIGKMDALRLAKLADIEKRLNAGDYSFAEAYRDIQDYGYQGSLDAALSDITKKAGTEQAAAKEKIKTIKKLDEGLGASTTSSATTTRKTSSSASEPATPSPAP